MTMNIQDDRGFNQVWGDSKATRVRTERRCDMMLDAMELGRPVSILEIGCGLGSNAYFMASKTGMEVLGVDLCRPFIEEAQRRYPLPNLSFKALDFNRPDDLTAGQYDYVVGNGILHHLYQDLDKALLNIRRLLKPGGKLIFFEPNVSNPYVFLIFRVPPLRKVAHLEPDEMAFSKWYAMDVLRNAGFGNIHVEFKDFLLPGIPEFLIQPSITAGRMLERLPLLRTLSQSLLILGTRQS
jgi:SAM-dependent methyltransferase